MSAEKTLHIFIITADWESEQRRNHVASLQKIFPTAILQQAINPRIQKVPFLDKMIRLSATRTGIALNPGEMGVLLSNRAIWRKVLSMEVGEEDYFLILESDSRINDRTLFQQKAVSMLQGYDLFFFGGWMGKILLHRSTRRPIAAPYFVGDANLKTICSGYGYAINKKAAAVLLRSTAKIGWPADEFKRYLPKAALRIGAVSPEIISEMPGSTTIGHPSRQSFWYDAKMQLVYLRNHFVSYFS